MDDSLISHSVNTSGKRGWRQWCGLLLPGDNGGFTAGTAAQEPCARPGHHPGESHQELRGQAHAVTGVH